ncbi:MAG: cytidylate kinase-like family protein [Muribaculaceae bacterium]|nr:cytidylate kinase-like family protein [Muribaculaceae bacterium]
MEEKADDVKIIVIGRQYGGGGRKVGKAVARLLGIQYYDKEIINKVSDRYGYHPEILDMADEKKPSAFRSMMLGKYGVMDMYATSPMSREGLYSAQTDVIRQICREGSCVIVGRTADYIMRDHPGLTSVFIHAPKDWRARNIIGRGETMTETEAMAKLKKADSDREGYYNYFTGRRWGAADNYHLSIDASKLDTDSIARLIVSFIDFKKLK